MPKFLCKASLKKMNVVRGLSLNMTVEFILKRCKKRCKHCLFVETGVAKNSLGENKTDTFVKLSFKKFYGKLLLQKCKKT